MRTTATAGTSNSGTQPLTTIINITWIHARSGQPLAMTLNGTVRGLTYKQEAGGSSPSPPTLQDARCGAESDWLLGAGCCEGGAGSFSGG